MVLCGSFVGVIYFIIKIQKQQGSLVGEPSATQKLKYLCYMSGLLQMCLEHLFHWENNKIRLKRETNTFIKKTRQNKIHTGSGFGTHHSASVCYGLLFLALASAIGWSRARTRQPWVPTPARPGRVNTSHVLLMWETGAHSPIPELRESCEVSRGCA